jgi:hypothetical protein
MRFRASHYIAFAVAAATISALPATSQAQNRLHGMARFGLEYGGDRVVEFTYEDGSTPKVTAGGGLLLSVGGGAEVARFGAHTLDAQLNAGLKWRTIPAATNQDANWLRFPVEGMLFYHAPKGFRLGAGATVHLRNVLKASGEVLNDKVEFKNTPGFLLQADYIRKNVAFDLRYTAMDYEVESSGGSINASSVGLGISYFFGRSSSATGPTDGATR